MLKAFKQEKDADLVIFFYTWEDWKIEKPAFRKENPSKPLSQKLLCEIISDLNIECNLVVVILDKRDSDIEIEEIEEFLKEFGFSKVVFQAGISNMHPDGRPIIKE